MSVETVQNPENGENAELLVEQAGPVLTVTFNRPAQRNAMTFAMYDGLHAACERADSDDEIRVLVLRGAGDKAFVAGTDIAQFATFTSGDDGVRYEEGITRVVNRLEDVGVPTVAAVRGFCIGGGLAIAAACDLRVATRSAQFGVPIARTLGNCLSMNTFSLLVSHLGPARTLDVLLRARLLTGDQAHAAGFVAELCDDDQLEAVTDGVVQTLLGHAPLSMWAAKEAVRRIRRANVPDGDDIVSRVFASDDFHAAVAAFANKETVVWQGK
jgi:enoyl-CoA hydratase/carnithine racemase